MAKSNPSLTSITPASAGERNFVNIHRDNTEEPLNKDLANNGKNGMNDASSKVKTFPRKEFHFGNDMADSITDYDPKESMSGTELARKHHFGRRLNKKYMFVNGKEKKTLKEATRKDQLAGIEKYYTDRMNDKMDKQANFEADPNDPDYRGEISFHNAMRAWAARQRIASPYNIHGDETSGHGKRIAQFSKEMIKRAKERKSDNSYARNESLVEHLPANASVKDYIDDFQKSDDPRFAGKSAEKRRKMAIAAWYSRNESLNEISSKVLGNYIKKSSKDIENKAYDFGFEDGEYGRYGGHIDFNGNPSKERMKLDQRIYFNDKAINKVVKRASGNDVTKQRRESLNEVSRHKLFKYIKKTEPSVPSEDTHAKGRNLAKDKLGYGTNRAKVMAKESLNETNYHTLFTREEDGGRWSPQFGDYDPAVVKQEMRDSYGHIKGKHKKIVKHGEHENQIEIGKNLGEGEVIYLSRSPKYVNKVPASKRFELHQSNTGNERVRKQAERLGYIKDKYPKSVSEFVDPHTLGSAVKKKKKINEGKENVPSWLQKLGDRLPDPVVQQKEELKSILRHKEKEAKKKKMQEEALVEKVNLVKNIITAGIIVETSNTKYSHEEVSYGHGKPNGEHCGACKHYQVDKGGKMHCELVVDPILPNGWCKLFEEAKG